MILLICRYKVVPLDFSCVELEKQYMMLLLNSNISSNNVDLHMHFVISLLLLVGS